ncbi:hypothetical protein D9758_007416 [Tetrapyrgos nigripes]|uniref:Peptidase S53 domain-containing protein n=1 Tax=Tetrapyrgos nigripes TaxID=182062 RepID=A0A8H5G3D2_9AGAR|nr:hypothetical protein D9758_007416 [Tetrapyrgos nigripes]
MAPVVRASFLLYASLALYTVIASGPVTYSSIAHAKRVSVLRERRDIIPNHFAGIGAPHEDTILQLKIGLQPNNRSGLEQALFDVSTPGGTQYGKHLTAEEVHSYMSAHPSTSSIVLTWLLESGVPESSITLESKGSTGDWLALSVPVPIANDLFSTEFHTFLHKRSGETIIRALEYSVPLDLVEHISLVHPIVTFGIDSGSNLKLDVTAHGRSLRAQRSTRDNGTEPEVNSGVIDESCATKGYSGVIGVPGLIQQWAQKADLNAFLERYRPDMDPNTTFSLETLTGGEDPQGPDKAGSEANLDIQYTVGLATGVPTTFISAGCALCDGAHGFLDVVEFISNQTNPPQVISMSYGFTEEEISPDLAKRICDAYMALTARGVSLIFGSGDAGVSGAIPGNETTCTSFVPTFPVAVLISPPGGFSNVFSQPSFQQPFVSAYLESTGVEDTYAGRFNASGRGFPDVSTQANHIQIVVGGNFTEIWGTSASGPIFASMIALVNDRLIGAGKPPLGYLNPFLYANPQIFNDITSGNNPGCNTEGFNATKGWDPITGLGTPNFEALLLAAGIA